VRRRSHLLAGAKNPAQIGDARQVFDWIVGYGPDPTNWTTNGRNGTTERLCTVKLLRDPLRLRHTRSTSKSRHTSRLPGDESGE
jgi:hypothetical protein